jgi:hypothetical protein
MNRTYFIAWAQFWLPIEKIYLIEKEEFSFFILDSLKQWSLDKQYNIAVNNEMYYKCSNGFVTETKNISFENEDERIVALSKNVNIIINDQGVKVYLYGSFFKSDNYRENLKQIFKFMDDFKKIFVLYISRDLNDQQISLSRLDIACNINKNFQEYEWNYVQNYKRSNLLNQIQAPTMYHYYNKLGESVITGLSIGKRGSEFAYFRAYDKSFDPNNVHDMDRFDTVEFIRLEHELGHRKLKSFMIYDKHFKYNLGTLNGLKILYDYPYYTGTDGKVINQFENIITRLEYGKNVLFYGEKIEKSKRINNDFPDFIVKRWNPIKQINGCLRRCNDEQKKGVLHALTNLKQQN